MVRKKLFGELPVSMMTEARKLLNKTWMAKIKKPITSWEAQASRLFRRIIQGLTSTKNIPRILTLEPAPQELPTPKPIQQAQEV